MSTLKGEQGFQRKEIAKLLAWVEHEPPPDIVNLPNSLLICLAAPLKRALGRPIAVTLQGEDLFLEGLPEPYKRQALELIREQAEAADVYIAVSDYYAEFMSAYLGIPKHKMRTAPLGVNVNDLKPADGKAADRPFTVGYFARVAPEKGLHHLAEAYRILRQERGLPRSRLRAAGYISNVDRRYLAEIEGRLASWGLRDEFDYLGTVDRAAKVRFFHDVDVLSVPSPYHEPKGLYLLEAMACGVPVVQPDYGAFPEMIRRTGGGLLAASERPADIADGLHALWRDPAHAAALGERGAQGVRAHYTVDHMADRMLEVYRELADKRAGRIPSHQALSVASR